MPATRVGYQGEPGAYSEAAGLEVFKPTGVTVEMVGYPSFDAVFDALAKSEVEYITVPVENTLGGSIHVNYDLMLRHHGGVHVLGEHSFRVRHALLALPGVKKEDIKRAMSHPQALAQTAQYLEGAHITPVSAYDTAGSAKLVREQGLRDTAAIASARAADVHGLEVLDYGIEDDPNNFTRFLVLGRKPCELPEDAAAKTSVVFVPKRNEVGVLHKALSCFAQRDIDLSKIESRPFRLGDLDLGNAAAKATATGALAAAIESPAPAAKRPRHSVGGGGPGTGAAADEQQGPPLFEYAFYLDLLCKGDLPHCQNAFRHLEELTHFVKVLGTYPVEGLLLPADKNGAEAPVAPSLQAPRTTPLRLGVLGFGTFGQFLARRWVRRGHIVYAQSRSDYSAIASAMGVHFVTKAEDLIGESIDVLVVCTSILSFEKVLKSLPPALLAKSLVADMLSVKSYAKDTMLAHLPATSDILCMHPMFGPESGKGSWQGLPCVFEQVRVNDFHRCARFMSLFEDEGCRMVRMTCEKHDQLAAGSQFVTHLTGRLLSRLNLQPSPIATAGFKALLKLVDNTCSDSFDLFYALYSHNAQATEQLEQFAEAFDDLRRDLTTFDSGAGSSASGANGSDGVISKLISSIPMSPTAVVFAKAAELKRQGKPLISLSVGEPDVLPSPEVMAAAHKALDDGHVKYTEVPGMLPLREAICSYLKKEKKVTYAPDQVVVANGGKQALLQTFMSVLDPGDEVIVPAPYWVSYNQIAAICGAKAVVINTREEDAYCLMPGDLEAHLTAKTKILVLCNPSNPTGAVHPSKLLNELAAVLRKFPRCLIVADEIYEQILFDEKHLCFAAIPGMYERTIIINGFSKGPAMTGFRLGYLAAPLAIAKAAGKVQSQNTTSPSAVSQYAGLAALTSGAAYTKWLKGAVAGYRQKRDMVLKRLRAMPGVSHAYEPQGAFYAFPSVEGLFGKTTPQGVTLTSSADVCIYLMEQSLVAVMPGEAFGDGRCIRISYAESMETLGTALDRMEEGIKALK